jgi:hypothetical protein
MRESGDVGWLVLKIEYLDELDRPKLASLRFINPITWTLCKNDSMSYPVAGFEQINSVEIT